MNPRTPPGNTPEPGKQDNPDVRPDLDKPIPTDGVESPGDAQRPVTPPGTTTS
jgi:hypothetical protein